MSPREVRPLTDDDPTVEEEAPEFDLSRTDQIEKPKIVPASDDGGGTAKSDEPDDGVGSAKSDEPDHGAGSAKSDQPVAAEEPKVARPVRRVRSYNPYDKSARQTPKQPHPPKQRKETPVKR